MLVLAANTSFLSLLTCGDENLPGVDGNRLAVQAEVYRVGMPSGPVFRLQHGNRHVGRAGKVPGSACHKLFI